MKARTDAQKGYHASADVKGKECAKCHNDHHGKEFEIIRFDKDKFNHDLTGYKLAGAHAKKKCTDCHQSKNISDTKIRTKKFSYLGLKTDCSACHADYHQKTLSSNCGNCHDYEAFKPAEKFDHAKAKFQLIGKHKTVECAKCHKTEIKDNVKFQTFTGLQYSKCTDCHTDAHKNQFGQNCVQCHTEESFHQIKGLSNFDHTKTKYRLEEKHLTVDCKKCHKKEFTDPLKHEKCTDCHSDYHQNQFAKAGISPDCSQCHTVKGFTEFSYTIEQHNQGVFGLVGPHAATPCFDCHKKTEKWSFKEIGKRCADCHSDIHKDFIDKKYYPESNCEICHKVGKWSAIAFDHSKTDFRLSDAHEKTTCRQCHFTKNPDGSSKQQFANLSTKCSNCHADKHDKQFEVNGFTDCSRCHETGIWKTIKFDHNTTNFKLDGKHENVSCSKCHKEKTDNQTKYIEYKIKDYKCENCHS